MIPAHRWLRIALVVMAVSGLQSGWARSSFSSQDAGASSQEAGSARLAGVAVEERVASPAPPDARLVAAKWHAEWIACPDAPERDAGVYYFRKEIDLGSVPGHLRVHVSADNRFVLHVNGKYAGEGPARGDVFHWRYETIDLAPLLHAGKNVIAAVVWNFGSRAPVAQMSNRTGFLLQADLAADEGLDTDKSWMVEEERGRGARPHPGYGGYYAAGPAERVDGREVDWSWDQAEVAHPQAWHAAEGVGHAATREASDADNAWELVQDELPPMEHRQVEAGRAVRVEGLVRTPAFPAAPLEVPANGHVTLLLDNRVLQTAYPELTVTGGRGAEIRLTYSEALYDAKGDKANRNEIEGRHIAGVMDEFISDGGDARVYAPLWWRTWRYLQVDVTTKGQPVRLDGLKAWFTAYPFAERARIAGDIPDLDALWRTGWRTARLCAHETYMDAPYWEQLQYVGDTRIQALISYAMTGDSRLAKQAIENIDTSRTPEGITESRYPSGLPQFIPPFSLLWVNMVHDYWMYVDDEALVKETVPHTRTPIDWYAAHLRPDGLMGKVGWWEFADWTGTYPGGAPPQEADGGSTFLTLQFIEALKDAAELEAEYGSQERAAEYREMMRKGAEGLRRMAWDARYGLFADTPAKKTYSREANVLAVWLEVAPKAEQAGIIRRVLGAKEAGESTVDGKAVPAMSEMSFYFRFYLARALEKAGLEDEYVDQLAPWQGMLKLGLSTWAETPEPTRSDCHAWSASPNYDLLTVVAGIHPAAPGFKRVRIEPHLGKLEHLEAAMPHAGGEIAVRYEKRGAGWTAQVGLPAGLTGELEWRGRSYALKPGAQTVELR
jgi:alpha-L-rhamnosidase